MSTKQPEPLEYVASQEAKDELVREWRADMAARSPEKAKDDRERIERERRRVATFRATEVRCR